ANLARTLRALEGGGARARDVHHLEEAAGFMAMHGYCAHDRVAAAALTGLLRRFQRDVEAHLEAGGCPRPGGARDPFAAGSPERRAIESQA
ncbi:MAG TPA: NADH-ubiquinone oxidoreductase-F iron-sulfur binding region domain-containing protein, partial [Vicinamibacteria bacterium]|nr:NADH-ubiquinone oxidoreductase-F iron-sulfur binding region domain-containing protein [Vicinamibacteria bacterium]